MFKNLTQKSRNPIHLTHTKYKFLLEKTKSFYTHVHLLKSLYFVGSVTILRSLCCDVKLILWKQVAFIIKNTN